MEHDGPGVSRETPAVARLEELARAWGLPAGAPAQLGRLLDLVAAEPSSITTVREAGAAAEVHVADSLSGLAVGPLRAATAIADLGSGGGFPGLVLAAALPQAAVALVESVGRKAEFLDRAATVMGLTNVRAVNARAEAWPAGIGRFDAVTARALAPLGVVLEYAAPLLRPGGVAVAWKGFRNPEEEAAGDAAAAELGLVRDRIVVAEGLRHARERHLYVYVKVAPTPSRYPRRPGMARKRPIGRSTRG